MIDYYKEIIPDLETWDEVVAKPLPTTIWANTLKITPQALQTLLAEFGIKAVPLPWNPVGFRVASTELGKIWPYYAGLYQIQEEVSMLSGVILNPKPGDRVLDMCAAPGNKTAQMAVAMQNRGTLIANDRNFGRMRALGQISKRLGLLNISTTIYDGVGYPALGPYFDKVMVDAPCSCEGTFRKGAGKVVVPNRDKALKMGRVQAAILQRAVRLTRQGGHILYSTCTFSPEENERVVHDILRRFPGKLRVCDIHLDHFVASPGVVSWAGEDFDPQLRKALRVWPHQNNTGGFFVALLEVLNAEGDVVRAKRARPAAETVDEYVAEQVTRFDFDPSLFEQYRFSKDSQRGIYMTNLDNAPPSELKIDATGLFAIKTNIQFPKLTTAPAMLLGPFARRNVVELTDAQQQVYFAGDTFVLEPSQLAGLTDTGYVIVKFGDYFLGTGLYFEARGDEGPRVRSLFPKYLRRT